MHTHHSHSGQYVQHAHDSLDEVVASAAAKGFHIFSLTEHMPRYDAKELYTEEIESNTTIDDLVNTFDQYYAHARRLQSEYASAALKNEGKKAMKILVGFESESISDQYPGKIADLRSKYQFDLVVGSVHHVHGIPIDYDKEQWVDAAKVSAKNAKLDLATASDADLTRALFNDYFDLQYQMLQTTRPTVVGHFDLIRLYAGPLYLDSVIEKEWPEVWSKIRRNVRYVIEQGSTLFELNSSAIRKGWDTPYPRPDIARLILEEGGRFCLSDDSHGVGQVGLNFHKCIKYLDDLGVKDLSHLDIENGRSVIKSTPLETIKTDSFWDQYPSLN